MDRVKEIFKFIGETIAKLVNSLLLAIVYIIGVGLSALVAKAFNKHFLKLKVDKNKKSYWEKLNSNKKPIDEYYRQF